MPDITFIDAQGQVHGFEAADGLSVMAVGTGYGVPGIVGECGGSMVCATCHVVVDEAWIDRLPPPSPDELAMLDNTAVPRARGSRLACQITLTPDLQGLLLQVPDRQY